MVYFVATRPGWYHPIFPAYVTGAVIDVNGGMLIH